MSEKKKCSPWRIVEIICIVAFAAALAVLLLYLLRGCAPIVEQPSEQTFSSDGIVYAENPIDFAALKAENPDTVAWIRVPGTVIDYQIMQSGPDVEEDFYLNHDPQRVKKVAGSIYMQTLNKADFTDPNTVLYGHYMRNGSMFAALHKFRKQPFFEENSLIYIYIPKHILTYRIYSAFVYDDRHILNSFDFFDKDEYADYIEQTLHPNTMAKQLREGVTVTTDDRIITLSTCTTRNDQRYLVEGVLIDDQLTY